MAKLEPTNIMMRESGRDDGIPMPHWDVRNLSAGGDSVHGDENYVQINGNASALRTRGVDPGPGFKGASEDQPVDVLGIDGNRWQVYGEGLFLFARRERTEAEREQYFDRLNARYVSDYFSTDRIKLIELISIEMMDTAEKLAKVRRGDIRKLRRKLDVLGTAQWQLARRAQVDMSQIRAKLREVGLVVKQVRRDDLEKAVH